MGCQAREAQETTSRAKSESPEYVRSSEEAVELGVNRIAVAIKEKMLLIKSTISMACCWCAIGREILSKSVPAN